MTAEGTMNRSALPAIFNPEDLNAWDDSPDAEQAALASGGPFEDDAFNVDDPTLVITLGHVFAESDSLDNWNDSLEGFPRSGTACRCMFDPMRARLASSFSKNGTREVATLSFFCRMRTVPIFIKISASSARSLSTSCAFRASRTARSYWAFWVINSLELLLQLLQHGELVLDLGRDILHESDSSLSGTHP
jgi:hypothetical protein